MKKLITSALPYVNNLPHLGNLVQVLSADAYARFCRGRGYKTLYICGTDEYGTATEARALEEKKSPQELCDYYYAQHRDIYQWFNISFDKFGRTSSATHKTIVQDIFTTMHSRGYVTTKTEEQFYSERSQMFLADRYIRGTCPNCDYQEARGDQCEKCGKLLDPIDLVNPVSSLDHSTPVIRKTTHLYIDLPKLAPQLQEWLVASGATSRWTKNATQMTSAWIRDGLRERAITRDLIWGIPVPLEGFTKKVFYVWFDAPIGYISITADYTDEWKTWWMNSDVELNQFVGKDNIPFHTVIFPCTLLASDDKTQPWTKLHNISSSEYLNYEAGMFSKSRGIGVFGNDAIESGIPADMWRSYIFYNRPESSDYTFTWEDFMQMINGELIGNMCNFCNRALSFFHKYAESELIVPDMHDSESAEFWSSVCQIEEEVISCMEKAELRSAYRGVFKLAKLGNRVFQNTEPWKLRTSDLPRTKRILGNLVYLIRDLGILSSPFTPNLAIRMCALLGLESVPTWDVLGKQFDVLTRIQQPELLFSRLEEKTIAKLKSRYSGSLAQREEHASRTHTAPNVHSTNSRDSTQGTAVPAHTVPNIDLFTKKVDLKTALVVSVQQHPNADKLYVLELNDGSGEPRTIVSGIREFYAPEDLVGKTIIIVANLKKAKFRGVESRGMLLAVSTPNSAESQEAENIEVLFADTALQDPSPGLPVRAVQQERAPATQKEHTEEYPKEYPKEYTALKASAFFEFPLRAKGTVVYYESYPLTIITSTGQHQLISTHIADGPVG